MAKTLGLRVPAGFDNAQSLDDIIVPASPNTGKLSAIVASIFAASLDAMFAVVDVSARRVYSGAVDGLTPLDTILALGAGVELVESLEQHGSGDDRSSVWRNAAQAAPIVTIVPGAAGLVEAFLAPALPALSLSALIDKIEDGIALQFADPASDPFGLAGDHGVIVIDQATKIVSLVKATTLRKTDIVDMVSAAGALESTGTYEQIPAEEAVEGVQTFGL